MQYLTGQFCLKSNINIGNYAVLIRYSRLANTESSTTLGDIALKLAGFKFTEGASEIGGVNTTLGLPIIRTSVDHGTAFDIAGKGVASPLSMIEAVEMAAGLVEGRRQK